MSDSTIHLQFAVDCFNGIWKILDQPQPDHEAINEAILLAHTSTWHWKHAGTEIHQQRGEWIISRVYARFGFGSMALYHAQRCLAITDKNKFDDFDLAYAYEAMWRSLLVSEQPDEARVYFDKAMAAAQLIQKEEDRQWVLKDLAAAP
ncbi:MAG: hypothetical protein U0T84_08810 [Chitinophagales bacterium]